MIEIHTPVTVTARDYTGPATIVGRSTWAHGALVSSYRVEIPSGQRLRVGPGEVSKPCAARDVPPGESWAFREHRTMAQVIANELAQAEGRDGAA